MEDGLDPDGDSTAGAVISASQGDLCIMGGRLGEGQLGEGVISERVTVWSWKEAKRGGKGILCLRRRPRARGTGSDKRVSLYTILIAVNFSGQVQQQNIIRFLVSMRRMGGERERKERFINNSVARLVLTKMESYVVKRYDNGLTELQKSTNMDRKLISYKEHLIDMRHVNILAQ